MINGNELRIGNWVYQEDKDHKKRVFQISNGNDIDGFDDYPDQGEPILLTTEILYSIGFTKSFDDYGGWLAPEVEGERLRIREMKNFFYYNVDQFANPLIIKSVHKLQNWYYLFTDEELMIDEQELKRSVAREAK